MSQTTFHRLILAAALASAVAGIMAGTLPQSAQRASNSAQPFSIIVLPDTQRYALANSQIAKQQTRWIIENQHTLNIAFVTQLGDVVENESRLLEWERMSDAFSELDGRIPYGMAPGNHDIIHQYGSPNFEHYFPKQRVTRSALPITELEQSLMPMAKVGVIDDTNFYHLFEAGGHKFIALNLEFCPTDSTLRDTRRVLRSFRDRIAIISTHSFLEGHGNRETDDNTCHAFATVGDNSGADMWDKLIEPAAGSSVRLILSGHDISNPLGAARRVDRPHGSPIYQMLSNYQHFQNGGNGYLRILTFDPRKDILKVQTYSPLLDRYLTNSANEFSVPFEL